MSKLNQYTYCSNEKYDCLVTPCGTVYTKDKSRNRYYEGKTEIPLPKNKQALKRTLRDCIAIAYLITGFIATTIVFVKWNSIFISSVGSVAFTSMLSILFLLLNVVAHESMHALMLVLFHRRVSKIGFRWNFIFPSIFVDTSDSYLLPRSRRLYVYAAGVVINFILSAILVVIFPQYAPCASLTVLAALLTILPFGAIKTDGYNIIVNVLLQTNDLKGKSNVFFRISRAVFVLVVSTLLIVTVTRQVISFFM